MTDLDDVAVGRLMAEVVDRLEDEDVQDRMMSEVDDHVGDPTAQGNVCEACNMKKSHTGGGCMTCPRCYNIGEITRIMTVLADIVQDGQTFEDDSAHSRESSMVREYVDRLMSHRDEVEAPEGAYVCPSCDNSTTFKQVVTQVEVVHTDEDGDPEQFEKGDEIEVKQIECAECGTRLTGGDDGR